MRFKLNLKFLKYSIDIEKSVIHFFSKAQFRRGEFLVLSFRETAYREIRHVRTENLYL